MRQYRQCLQRPFITQALKATKKEVIREINMKSCLPAPVMSKMCVLYFVDMFHFS